MSGVKPASLTSARPASSPSVEEDQSGWTVSGGRGTKASAGGKQSVAGHTKIATKPQTPSTSLSAPGQTFINGMMFVCNKQTFTECMKVRDSMLHDKRCNARST
jgi:hypothetical protein